MGHIGHAGKYGGRRAAHGRTDATLHRGAKGGGWGPGHANRPYMSRGSSTVRPQLPTQEALTPTTYHTITANTGTR